MDFNQHGICEHMVLVNGTMIRNPNQSPLPNPTQSIDLQSFLSGILTQQPAAITPPQTQPQPQSEDEYEDEQAVVDDEEAGGGDSSGDDIPYCDQVKDKIMQDIILFPSRWIVYQTMKVIVKTLTTAKGVDKVFDFFVSMKNMEIGGAGKSKVKQTLSYEFGIIDHIFIGGGIEWSVFVRIVPNQSGLPLLGCL